MDKIIESVTKFIEENVTEDNYDIQDGAFIWAEQIIEHLRTEGYLKS